MVRASHTSPVAQSTTRTLGNTEFDLFQAAPSVSCLQINMKTHPELVVLESLLTDEISGYGPRRSLGDLLQTEMDARFLHVASPLSLLFWLITPTQLSTHRVSDRWPPC